MVRKLAAIIVAVALVAAVSAAPEDSKTTPIVEISPAKVEGLEITASQTVPYNKGFVPIQAKCAGSVQWLVLVASNDPDVVPAYKVYDTEKEVIVAVPPTEALITVFCIGVVDGKLTPFARTDIVVSPPPTAGAGKPAAKPEVKVTGKLYATIIEDAPKRTREIAAILNDVEWRKPILASGGTVFVYDASDSTLQSKHADMYNLAKSVGAYPVLVIQEEVAPKKGKVLYKGVLPKNEKDLLDLVTKFTGR